MTVEEIQRQSAPKDDLKPYAGRWVALRDGHVIANALDAVTLRDDPAVREDDMILPVPRHPGGTYVL
jgi:hypothetical protein